LLQEKRIDLQVD